MWSLATVKEKVHGLVLWALRLEEIPQHHLGYAFIFNNTYAPEVFLKLHMSMFYLREITAVDVAAVHSVYFAWNMCNDVCGAYLADSYYSKFGTRLPLVRVVGFLTGLFSVLPFFDLGLPVRVHYFISIFFMDAFISTNNISRVALMSEITASEEERIQMKRLMEIHALLLRIMGAVIYFAWSLGLNKFSVFVVFMSVLTMASTEIGYWLIRTSDYYQSLRVVQKKKLKKKLSDENLMNSLADKNIDTESEPNQSRATSNEDVNVENSAPDIKISSPKQNNVSLLKTMPLMFRQKNFLAWAGFNSLFEAMNQVFVGEYLPILIDILLPSAVSFIPVLFTPWAIWGTVALWFVQDYSVYLFYKGALRSFLITTLTAFVLVNVFGVKLSILAYLVMGNFKFSNSVCNKFFDPMIAALGEEFSYKNPGYPDLTGLLMASNAMMAKPLCSIVSVCSAFLLDSSYFAAMKAARGESLAENNLNLNNADSKAIPDNVEEVLFNNGLLLVVCLNFAVALLQNISFSFFTLTKDEIDRIQEKKIIQRELSRELSDRRRLSKNSLGSQTSLKSDDVVEMTSGLVQRKGTTGSC